LARLTKGILKKVISITRVLMRLFFQLIINLHPRFSIRMVKPSAGPSDIQKTNGTNMDTQLTRNSVTQVKKLYGPLKVKREKKENAGTKTFPLKSR
jgi:hypothetical protein